MDSRSARPAVVAVVGPTAAGKSDLALAVAQAVGGEVVNADSMQLYRGMDIGTAKVAPRERRGITHHLLDVWDVRAAASVAAYQQAARAVIDRLRADGVTPVLVGGSGLYVRAVLDDLQFPGTDPAVRTRLEHELATSGPEVLHARLAVLAPAAAVAILPTNGRRVVRALEVVELTGTFTATLPELSAVYPAVRIGLDVPRPLLDQRITARVDRMWDAGLVQEVMALAADGLREGPTASVRWGTRRCCATWTGSAARSTPRPRPPGSHGVSRDARTPGSGASRCSGWRTTRRTWSTEHWRRSRAEGYSTSSTMPEGAVSSGTVLAAAASTWISGGGGGSVWKYVPGPYSWPVPHHDPAVLEHSALVPGDSLTASAVEVPGHALGEEPVRPSGSSRIQQVAGAFGARASVGLVVDQVRVVGQVRDLVDDGVGCVPHDHVAQRVGAEDVAHVGLRPERVQDRDLVGRARQPEHVVTGRDEQRHQPDSDDAGRTGHHDPHPSTIRPCSQSVSATS